MGSFQEKSIEDFELELKEYRKLRGWKRLSSSFQNAFNGLVHVWNTQQNFRIEVLCAIIAITLAIYLNANLIPILLCCALVLCLELINSAIEYLVDLVSPNYHSSAKHAKDIGAGLVLLAAIVSVIVAIYVFTPLIMNKFRF